MRGPTTNLDVSECVWRFTMRGFFVACACAATVALAGCQPAAVTDTSRTVYCEVAADAPVRDNAEKPTKVIATTRFRCDQPGASTMTLTTHLQHQNSAGAWVDLNSTTFTAKGKDTVPSEGAF